MRTILILRIADDYSTDLTDRKQFAYQKNDQRYCPKKQNRAHTDFCISICTEYYILNLELLAHAGSTPDKRNGTPQIRR